MVIFEWTLGLLFGAVLLVAVARRLALPYPALLALAGAGLAFLPFAPAFEIDPDLALALFVAPVLLDAAFDTSPRELRRNILPLASLTIAAVAVTTLCVAYLGWRWGGLPIAAAVALGAIVAPPDAAAAAAVLGQFSTPRRISLILQGESLLNDATALLIYRMAVAAATALLPFATMAPTLALATLGSVGGGYIAARLYMAATMRVRDAASSTVLQFIATFGVWLGAERLALSPIITTIVYAMTLAQFAPRRAAARNRVSSYSVWETAVFVLNVLAFELMGLQARPILARFSAQDRWAAVELAVAVLVTVIVVRLLWVMGYGIVVRALKRMLAVPPPAAGPIGIRGDILIGWCGMRGLVTLAAAFALPADFPSRDVIVLSAFGVVLGTLVLQGLTLRPLLAHLHFEADGSIEREVSLARIAVMQAALDCLEGETSSAAAAVREQYAAARAIAADAARPQAATDYDELRLRAVVAQRATLDRLRRQGAIGDEAYHRLEEEIDWAELDAAPAGRFQPLTT